MRAGGWLGNVVDRQLAMMEETPSTTLAAVDPSTMWVSYGYGGEGYAYVFPKRQHVNAGVGYLLSYYREALGERGLLRGQSSRADFTPYLIPVGGPAQTTGAERVLLAGDAGGFVNAFTAEGIYYAMVTGELAARALLDTPASSRHTIASTRSCATPARGPRRRARSSTTSAARARTAPPAHACCSAPLHLFCFRPKEQEISRWQIRLFCEVIR